MYNLRSSNQKLTDMEIVHTVPTLMMKRGMPTVVFLMPLDNMLLKAKLWQWDFVLEVKLLTETSTLPDISACS